MLANLSLTLVPADLSQTILNILTFVCWKRKRHIFWAERFCHKLKLVETIVFLWILCLPEPKIVNFSFWSWLPPPKTVSSVLACMPSLRPVSDLCTCSLVWRQFPTPMWSPLGMRGEREYSPPPQYPPSLYASFLRLNPPGKWLYNTFQKHFWRVKACSVCITHWLEKFKWFILKNKNNKV